MSKKTKFRDIYASTSSNDTFGRMYLSMAQSKKYQSLSIGAKQFYTLCRVQAQSSEGKHCLTKHSNEYGITYDVEKDFVFPASHLDALGVKRSNAPKYFKELMQAGFIELKECNQKRFRVNVYSFSNKWRDTS